MEKTGTLWVVEQRVLEPWQTGNGRGARPGLRWWRARPGKSPDHPRCPTRLTTWAGFWWPIWRDYKCGRPHVAQKTPRNRRVGHRRADDPAHPGYAVSGRVSLSALRRLFGWGQEAPPGFSQDPSPRASPVFRLDVSPSLPTCLQTWFRLPKAVGGPRRSPWPGICPSCQKTDKINAKKPTRITVFSNQKREVFI